MKKNYLLILLCLGITVFYGCKKDKKSDSGSTASVKGKLLIGYTWKITAETCNPAQDYYDTGTKITDLYAGDEPCNYDNTITFNSDGTMLCDEGPTKCNVSDDQSYFMDWKLLSNDTVLSFIWNGISDDETILTLNDTTIITQLIQKNTNDNITYTYVTTYTKVN